MGMAEVRVAAIQMDAQAGAVDANLAHAAELVEQAVARGAQLVVLPEMFSTGYEYSDRNYVLPNELDGPTGIWVAATARRQGVHLLGSFPARMPSGTYIVAMLAAPDGRQWVYRKIHVAMWENCYFDQGTEPVIAETDLGRIGLLICWDQVFTDLARAYQGRVDLLCIPSSPPTLAGQVEDASGHVLVRSGIPRILGSDVDVVGWFHRAQELHARSAAVPLIYAARCGTFHSSMPFGLLFLLALGIKDALRVLRTAGTRYLLRCQMAGRSCILNAEGERLASTGQEGEVVLVAGIQPGAPEPVGLPLVPRSRSLVSGIPPTMLHIDRLMISLGRRRLGRHAP
jgi:predicted amidohydrolase